MTWPSPVRRRGMRKPLQHSVFPESSPEGLCVYHRLSAPQLPPTLPDMEPISAMLASALSRQTFRLHTFPKLSPQSSRSQGQTSRLLSILASFPGSLLPPKLYLLCYTSGVPSVTVDSSWASPWWTSLLHEGVRLLEPVLGFNHSEHPWQRLPSLSYASTCPKLSTSHLAWALLQMCPLDLVVTSQFWKILHSLVMTLWALCTRLVAEGATGNSMQPLYLRITGACKRPEVGILATLWKNAILRLSTDDYAGSQKGPWPWMFAGQSPWRRYSLIRLKESVVQGSKAKPDGHVRRKKQHAETNVLILRFSALFEYPGLRLSSI